ncbi:MAG: hypothetical protein AAB540_02695, partial [Patescibacteria group bacterium]
MAKVSAKNSVKIGDSEGVANKNRPSKAGHPKPELLLPAGNLEKLKIGLAYGGDAFYLGFSPFSLRCNDSGFTKETLIEGVSLLKKNKKPFYVTMNIYPRG